MPSATPVITAWAGLVGVDGGIVRPPRRMAHSSGVPPSKPTWRKTLLPSPMATLALSVRWMMRTIWLAMASAVGKRSQSIWVGGMPILACIPVLAAPG